jgi:hypothetical protein
LSTTSRLYLFSKTKTARVICTRAAVFIRLSANLN